MEFLLDHDGNLCFMEMNARIQVEHPVSEMVTGLDLIQEQIRVAAGEPLGPTQDDVSSAATRSSAASTPRTPTGLRPAAGRLDVYVPPGGPGHARGLALLPGLEIAPFYDSLIAKLLVWAPTATRRSRMDRRCRVPDRGTRRQDPIRSTAASSPTSSFSQETLTTDFLEHFLAEDGEAAASGRGRT